jgi:uncharacterized protein YndB with AHSA1/START domain
MANALVVTTHVNAQPGELFPVWLSAESLKKWWWPEFPDATYAVEGREGGDYFIVSEERGMGIQGRYVTVEEPNRLEFTWTWIDHGMPGPESKVRVDFDAQDGGTLITVNHDVMNPDNLISYQQGWEYVLGNLAWQHAG